MRGRERRYGGRVGRPRLRSVGTLGAGAAAAALLLAACGGGTSTGTSTSTGTPVQGGTASFALPPNTIPNYIFPFMSLAHFSVSNISQFQYLMYRPLYWFGTNGQPSLNTSLSLANPPTYSNGGTTAVVTLKSYKWSDGTPVTATDVMFWMNMLKAEKTHWAAYVPGAFPDNVTSIKVDSPTQLTFTLNKAYSAKWFTYNELGQITPLPPAWDKTSATTTGSCATSVAACPAVYNYLKSQAKSLASYATNPLWGVVDGPWKLKSFSTDGTAAFVPNPSYSGPVKPHLAEFIEKPFTTDAAEYNVLRAGGKAITVGYIPMADVPAKAPGASVGTNPLSANFRLAPWIGWSINYFPENFNNPTVGPIFKQLYVRQAMQELVDQPTDISAAFKGYGYPTYGPVPVLPTNPFVSGYAKHNPYPYDPTRAISTLKTHGWTVTPNGTTTCTSPGSGPTQCGPGISAGAKMVFNLQYASGNSATSQIMQNLKSDFSKAGIVINLSQAPFNTVIGNAIACTPSQAACKWQMENWGGGWVYSPDYYPTGGELFATGAGSNSGSYSDPTNDHNIQLTHTDSSSSALDTYQNYLAQQLPVIWQPNPDYSLTEIANNLHGVTPQNPLLALTPENWYFTK